MAGKFEHSGGEQQDTVAFEDLKQGDVVRLSTENSEYRFTVTDPRRQIGTLEGGRLPEGRAAVLSGAVNDEQEYWGNGVRRGSRALFFMLTPTSQDGFNRVLTSDVSAVDVLPATRRRAA